MPENPLVAAPATPGVPDKPGMAGQGGVAAAGSTPAATMAATDVNDVEALRKQLADAQAAIDAANAAKEQDISRLRSSLQSDLARRQHEWEQEREEWRQRWSVAASEGLDENEKVKFDLQLALQEREEAQQKLREMEQALNSQSLFNQYYTTFLTSGVDPKKLVVDQGVEGLVASGYEALIEELTTYRTGKASAPAAAAPAAPATSTAQAPATPAAPAVVTSVTGSPATSTTIPKLVAEWSQKLGRTVTEEEFWRMVENKQIPFDANSVIQGMVNP